MPEPAAAQLTGLCTKTGHPIALAGVSVDAEISLLCARVAVTQRYVNRETTPIEAIYVFPLDEGAAVHGFEAVVDGALIVGEVKEREDAFARYDEALEQGHGGFLLDLERPDVFQASVGNVLPGKEVLLKIVYVSELTMEGSKVRFTVPTTVSPRYAPPADRAGVGRSDAEALNPPVAWQVPYGLGLTARVAMPGPIARVESPSHPVSVAMHGSTATVTLSQHETALDRDFVLSVEAAGLDRPQAWVERGDDGSERIAIAFVPSFEAGASTPGEIIFLVDRSGSMDGPAIQQVRNALQLCLRSMVPGCAFNVFGFGSTHDRLFPSSTAYDERSLTKASDHVEGLEANLGGTEILPALKAVLEQPPHGSLPRQVVVLTDGEVTNTDAVLALAAAHAGRARIFTFGIGASASHHLVRGLARAGGGIAEFIHPGERIEPKVVRQFGRLLSPALTDVRLDWGGLDVTQAPSCVPPVFSGGRLLMYGLLKQSIGSTKPAARLSAHGPSGPLRFDVTIDADAATSGTTIGALAARARIRELEESPAWINQRGSRQSARKAGVASQEIIALSLRYGVISRETSFVAIEHRDTPVPGDIQLRRIPIALAAGWGGMREGSPIAAPAAALASALFSGMPRPGRPLVFGRHGNAGSSARVIPPTLRLRADREARGRSQAPDDPARLAMLRLVRLQRADGTWDLTREFAAAIGRDLADLEAALIGAKGPTEEVRRAWATALAHAWLIAEARDAEQEWRALAAKAREWLARSRAQPAGADWLVTASSFLRP
jgi:Ca-activated chloride channel family protein